MKNKVQLITYVDRLTSSNIQELNKMLNNQLSGLFSGIHLLPFYYPIDGSDAGFDPIDHTAVDNRLGNWSDVKQLGQNYDVMADLIVNHMSAQSIEFQDVLSNGKDSVHWDLFLTKNKVFPNGLSAEQQEKIYRPRPGSCFTNFKMPNGSEEEFWTTFTENQIDIDIKSNAGQNYLNKILETFSENGIKVIRLDAAGYAVKKAGTSCFMLDDTYEFINELTQTANSLGIDTLVEIHSYYKTQIEIASRVDLVYDFALPPLILHSLFTGNFNALANWLSISPRNCITVLDTHDGIGIIDVGPMNGKPGLLLDEEINDLVETIHQKSNGESIKATGAAASNLDLYQVNCTYYDALSKNDLDYLIARAIQFFAPGTPQVYYTGLLAETNDMELLSNTNVGRNINRPYLNNEKVDLLLQKPVTRALTRLIMIRNQSEAFNGQFSVTGTETELNLLWQHNNATASLVVNLNRKDAIIQLSDGDIKECVDLAALLTSYKL